MPLYLHEEFCQEALADTLCSHLRQPRDPFALPTIVVQTAGLGRWLQLRIARTIGISAGLEMPLPRKFFAAILTRAGLIDGSSLFDPQALRWPIFDCFLSGIPDSWGEDASALRSYLDPSGPQFQQRAWQTAVACANLYDHYALFRPEWIRQWTSSKPAPAEDPSLPHFFWQGALLRHVLAEEMEAGNHPRQRFMGTACHEFANGNGALPELSAPLHIFGINGYAPAFLKVLKHLATTQTIHLYHLPCSEAYLGDLPSRRMSAQTTGGNPEMLPELAHNPLLSASAQAARRFQSLLLHLGFPTGDMPPSLNQPTTPATDLADLQNCLRLNLPRMQQLRADGSISLHACHGPLREIQILQQQLLALFHADPSLKPSDVLVLMPDIQRYSDSIEAVFGMGTLTGSPGNPDQAPHLEQHRRFIPFSLADHHGRRIQQQLRFLQNLIALLDGRQEFSSAVALFDYEPVARKLQTSPEQLAEAFQLLQDAGIRQGLDASSRAIQDLAPVNDYTWEFGLSRIIDGTIFNPSSSSCETTPLETPVQLLQTVAALAECLLPAFAFIRRRHQPRPFHDWLIDLLRASTAFFTDDEENLLPRLIEQQPKAPSTPLSWDTFKEILGDLLPQPSGAGAFLRGGMTFANLQPARDIPARVLCILGLDEGSFPRQIPEVEFDLAAAQRKRSTVLTATPFALKTEHLLGDPNPRENDRQLILNCLLLARERLYLSYNGFSRQTGEKLPPSLLLTELTNFLAQAESTPLECSPAKALARIWIHHPLQEWNHVNFRHPVPEPSSPPVPIHFDLRLSQPPAASQPFLPESPENFTPPPSSAPSPEPLPLPTLEKFLKNPVEHFLKRHLQIDLDPLKWIPVHSDEETMESDTLEIWELRRQTCDQWKNLYLPPHPVDLPKLIAHLHRQFILPRGFAAAQSERSAQQTGRFLNTHIPPARWDSQRFTSSAAGLSIEAEFPVFTYPDAPDEPRVVVFIFGKIGTSSRDLSLSALIPAMLAFAITNQHLCLLAPATLARIDIPAHADRSKARLWLENLAQAYTAHTEQPLPLDFRIAQAFAQKLAQASTHPDPEEDLDRPSQSLTQDELQAFMQEAFESVTEAFGRHQQPNDEAIEVCFGDLHPGSPESPWNPLFQKHAEQLVLPMLRWANEHIVPAL